MKRITDIFLTVIVFVLLFPIMMLIALIIKLTSKGTILYWSDRVGIKNRLFEMPKFRTMKINTPIVATHKLENPHAMLTPVGGILRRSSLDELPQLWSILLGDMSLVGPRPALFNQDDLIMLRTKEEVHTLLPGLTGWAQVNGRDELPIIQKVALDKEYLEKKTFLFDLKIIWLTVLGVLMSKGVTH